MVEPGRRILGERYELVRLIASGGMGQVWRGTDVLLGRPVAVKVLRSEYTSDPTFLARFRAEAQHAAALSHPNIASVFDYDETRSTAGETQAYLVMELVEGEPLSALLRREGRLDAPTTLAILQQTAAALAEAHRVGLVHRDVKPGNILVRADGRVKITDFGIAWSAGSVPLTRTGQVIGTPQYLSPEQAEGHLATPASDVYALGLVGYECLTGRPAFDGDNPVTIALKQLREDPQPLPGELAPGVRTLITRALAKDPAARMVDGAAFVAAIEDTRAGRRLVEPFRDTAVRPVTGTVPTNPGATGLPGGRTRRPAAPPRHRASALLVPLVALLLGAAVAAAVFVALSGPAPEPAVAAAQTHEHLSHVLADADFVGRPVDDVAAQLSALGFAVERHTEPSAVHAVGMVTRVSPTGQRLQPGDEVSVWSALVPGDDARSSTGTGGDGPRHSDLPVVDAGSAPPAPTEPPSPAPPPTSEPPPGSTGSSPTTPTATRTTASTQTSPTATSPTQTVTTSPTATSTSPTQTVTTSPTATSPSPTQTVTTSPTATSTTPTETTAPPSTSPPPPSPSATDGTGD